MARQLRFLIAFLCAGGVAFADENTPVPPVVPPAPPPHEKPPGEHRIGDRPFGERGFGREQPFQEVQKFFDTLPPETRDMVKQRFQEWIKSRGAQRPNPGGYDPERAKKFLENLPPEQREKFKQNFERWKNLPPEEREMLRLRDEFRRREVSKEVESALAQSGLKLNSEQRQRYTHRYSEERRKIEEELQREMAEKRAPRIRALVEKLNSEFASNQSAAPQK